MKKIIQNLETERQTLKDRIDVINNAIEAFQKVCKHTNEDGSNAMEYEGHDSHKNYYKCTICGYENWD